jgi:hypothetical protein
MRTGSHGACHRARVRATRWLENAILFDRDDEASDQSRDFVQMFGIMFGHGLRQPDQAFVITQGRDVAGHDRRNRPEENGLGVGHGITSQETGDISELHRQIGLFGARFVARKRGRITFHGSPKPR